MKYFIYILFFLSSLFAQQINIGMSTALDGPAKALGQNMKLGIEVAFKEENSVNKKHTFNLIALNDGYEPSLASKNIRNLINNENVLAVLGNVGTPTANVTVPIANELKTLLFGAFTGAGVLRKSPPDRYVINYRASYAQEAASLVDSLLDNGIKPEEIAFFTQNDGYGDAGYYGAIQALKKRGFLNTNSLAHGRYERNTDNIEDGLITILDSEIEPKVIILISVSSPAAEFIKLAREDFPDTFFVNVSGSNFLEYKLKENSDDIIITQVVPHFNSSLKIVKEYRDAFKKYAKNSALGFVSLEGYIVGKLFIHVVNSIKDEVVTRENIIDSFEKIKDLDIGLGFKSGFSKDEHQYSRKVWPTIIKNNQLVEFKWSDLNKILK